jgi:hypothetical protein
MFDSDAVARLLMSCSCAGASAAWHQWTQFAAYYTGVGNRSKGRHVQAKAPPSVRQTCSPEASQTRAMLRAIIPAPDQEWK